MFSSGGRNGQNNQDHTVAILCVTVLLALITAQRDLINGDHR